MNDFQYFLTLARGFAPAKPAAAAVPVAPARCDVIELRRHTVHPGEREINEAQEANYASDTKASGTSGE